MRESMNALEQVQEMKDQTDAEWREGERKWSRALQNLFRESGPRMHHINIYLYIFD